MGSLCNHLTGPEGSKVTFEVLIKPRSLVHNSPRVAYSPRSDASVATHSVTLERRPLLIGSDIQEYTQAHSLEAERASDPSHFRRAPTHATSRVPSAYISPAASQRGSSPGTTPSGVSHTSPAGSARIALAVTPSSPLGSVLGLFTSSFTAERAASGSSDGAFIVGGGDSPHTPTRCLHSPHSNTPSIRSNSPAKRPSPRLSPWCLPERDGADEGLTYQSA